MAQQRKRGTGQHDEPSGQGSTKTRNRDGITQRKATRMEEIFGFDVSDFASWSAFVRLMCRPMDPASLGLTRMVFGLLMTMDAMQERGLAYADYKWGDPAECRFPLFSFLRPLPLAWMFVVYFIMIIGSTGIMLGLFYRLSCMMFFVPYWYLFFLEKSHWNNHSYLFGLTGTMLFFMDGTRYMSLDGLRKPKDRNAHVPLWNYALIRAQFFLVYFLAGLKKTEFDWVAGYSMSNLSRHWVFIPFKLVLTDDMVDHYIVHIGGFLLDLLIGFFLYFDATRIFAMLFGAMFHLMNSQIFSIGMFPWTMLATLPLFCYVDWPRRYIRRTPGFLQTVLPTLEEPQFNEHCIYPKALVKPEEQSPKDVKDDSAAKTKPRVIPKDKAGVYHNAAVTGMLLYLALQCFLPYSHSFTKGYNNWTNGLYGYSWDMMVHSWSTQHIRITYKIKETNQTGYLNPQVFSQGQRWHSHADMIKQHALCVERVMADEYDIRGIELYYDIWRSLNDRFQQRQFDPRVDMITAEWSPVKEVPWLLPLLTGLSDWRGKLMEIEKQIYNSTNETDVVFVADFPGLTLENYIQPEFGNTTLQVLKGQVLVELLGPDEDAQVEGEGKGEVKKKKQEPFIPKNITVIEGETIQIPAGEYHNVHTVTDQPSCYMYVYTNTTESALSDRVELYEKRMTEAKNSGGNITALNETFVDVLAIYDEMTSKKLELEQKSNATLPERFKQFLQNKYRTFKRGFIMTGVAVQSVVTGRNMSDVYNSTIGGHPFDLDSDD